MVFQRDHYVVGVKMGQMQAGDAQPDGENDKDKDSCPEEQAIKYCGHRAPFLCHLLFMFMQMLTICYLQRTKKGCAHLKRNKILQKVKGLQN